MKLRLINTYKKASPITDVHNLPVIDEVTGRPKVKLLTMFRYALVEATAAEKAMYKKFRRQDGVDYYREAKLVTGEMAPIYVSSTFQGNTVSINAYTREDGKVGFSIDTTETDILGALAEQLPSQAAALQAQIVAAKIQGGTIQLANEDAGLDTDTKAPFDTEEENEEESSTAGAGSDQEEEENQE